MSVTGIAFTMYPVTDVARALTFYRDKLGLRQDGMNEAWWVEFDVGGATFGIGNVPDNGKPGEAQGLVLEVEISAPTAPSSASAALNRRSRTRRRTIARSRCFVTLTATPYGYTRSMPRSSLSYDSARSHSCASAGAHANNSPVTSPCGKTSCGRR